MGSLHRSISSFHFCVPPEAAQLNSGTCPGRATRSSTFSLTTHYQGDQLGHCLVNCVLVLNWEGLIYFWRTFAPGTNLRMAKPRRNVQFNHRGSNNHDGRRPSMSEVSEGHSEPGSPIRAGMNGKFEVSNVEVRLAPMWMASLAMSLKSPKQFGYSC